MNNNKFLTRAERREKKRKNGRKMRVHGRSVLLLQQLAEARNRELAKGANRE